MGVEFAPPSDCWLEMNAIPKDGFRDEGDLKHGFKERVWALVGIVLLLSQFAIAMAIGVHVNDSGVSVLVAAVGGAAFGAAAVWVPWSLVCRLGWYLAARRIRRRLRPGTTVEFTVGSSRRRRTRRGQVVRLLPQRDLVEIEVPDSSGNRRDIVRSIFDVVTV